MPKETHHKVSAKQHDGGNLLKKEFDHSEILRIAAIVSMLALITLVLFGLFAPGLPYILANPPEPLSNTHAFLNELEPLVGSKITSNNEIEVIENGDNFYRAELDAMQRARRSIDIEAYIFHRGKIADEVIETLTERARQGVQVNLVLDSLGSFSTPKSYFKDLANAGGRVGWYHRLRLHNWFIANNRTHREITIVDGSTAFLGGAGYADWWAFAVEGKPRWRDTMVRVQGDAVRQLQGTFAENFLAATGKIIDGQSYFPPAAPDPAGATALAITSSPPSGGPSHARILFQTLIAASHKSLYIATPYFLPDHSMINELVRARTRGVTVKIVVPGKHSDHALTRSSGRGAYGDLLKADAEIYEYEPAMIHAKIMTVDGLWSVVGSANVDSRSFGINDEVNLAILDAQVAAKLNRDFEQDLSHSHRVTLQEWERRSLPERVLESIGWVFERQQ